MEGNTWLACLWAVAVRVVRPNTFNFERGAQEGRGPLGIIPIMWGGVDVTVKYDENLEGRYNYEPNRFPALQTLEE